MSEEKHAIHRKRQVTSMPNIKKTDVSHERLRCRTDMRTSVGHSMTVIHGPTAKTVLEYAAAKLRTHKVCGSTAQVKKVRDKTCHIEG